MEAGSNVDVAAIATVKPFGECYATEWQDFSS